MIKSIYYISYYFNGYRDFFLDLYSNFIFYFCLDNNIILDLKLTNYNINECILKSHSQLNLYKLYSQKYSLEIQISITIITSYSKF